MTAPAQAAEYFAAACLLGMGLALVYGFLRPLRPGHPHLSDLMFLPFLFWAWLYLAFAVCKGDLRLGYTAGLFLGALAWESTVGRWLRPVFSGFWKLFLLPVKKFLKIFQVFAKKLLASWKKWVTILQNNRRSMRRTSGGTHDSENPIPGIHPIGPAQKHAPDDDRGIRRHRTVYGSAADPSRRH